MMLKKQSAKTKSEPRPAEGEAPDELLAVPHGYSEFLANLKAHIHASQVKTALAVNRELILLFWEIGRRIVERQDKEKWGAAVIEKLASDLRKEFPDMKGFSARNIWRMRAFYLAYTRNLQILPQPAAEIDGTNLPQVAAQIPWFHNVILIEKVKDIQERLWYIHQTLEHGWSRNVLALQIENDFYHRQGKAITNFGQTLPSPQSDLAQQTLKDPYIFDFLTIGNEAQERFLEKELIHHLTRFLLELGAGFAFIGRQYHLEISGEDFFIDLLFYHTKLHCYVAVELKAGGFKPEYAGKVNFYLSALDDRVKAPEDNPSIGLILCATKNRILAEYALRDIRKPIGVANWQTKLVKSLPKNLKGSLPSIEELETELSKFEEQKKESQ